MFPSADLNRPELPVHALDHLDVAHRPAEGTCQMNTRVVKAGRKPIRLHGLLSAIRYLAERRRVRFCTR